MATLARNKPRVFETGHDDHLNELNIIANDIVYDGAAVGESSSTGTYRPLVGGDNFGGFCTEQVDNTGGAASALRIKVKASGVALLDVTGVSSTAQVGDSVYATDDDTFTLTATEASWIGRVIRHVSGTQCLVAFRAQYVPSNYGDFATIAGTETLTNKTLTAPTITNPTLVTPVITTGLSASGSAANTFGDSTGTFITSSGLNTLSGFTTFKGIFGTAIAAAGTTVADAAQLGAANVVHISSDGATKGVKLQTGVAGQVVFVINTSSTAANLYAATGGTINGLSANASVVIPASKGAICFCTAADTWVTYDLTAKSTAT